MPINVQEEIIKKEAKFYVIDASKVAQEANLGKRTNTILQTCFFAISGVLPKAEAIQKIKDAIVKTYSHKGEKVVKMNFNAVDQSLANLFEVKYPKTVSSKHAMLSVMTDAPDGFVKEVLEVILSGRGDELPVSAFSEDGTFPTGTSQYEKSGIADFVSDMG
ncbi:MAG: 2-oxoacid:acceptor oxidoreductase family protein [Flavobacteriaceae bacterium]|nr:2-oxoacid:acceptor oxidoreductase family protein [Flavobacteriaceae bacterium]